MQRRNFLFNTALVGGLTATKLDKYISPVRKKPKSVIILGAGFAGLAAAYKLKKANIPFVILEARNRIGGRVFTHTTESQQKIELGAEWVGASHELLIKLCEEFGLKLLNNQFDSHLTIQGEYFKPEDWKFSDDFEKFWKDKEKIWASYSEAKKRKLDQTDWWRFLKNNGFPDSDIYLRELMDSTDFGESIRHTSAYAAFAEYAESSEKNEMDYKIEGGNSQLAVKLAAFCGLDQIKLNHKVVSIDQTSKHHISVKCENGNSFNADNIICTIPTYSIQKINWNPILPSRKQDAIDALQYARIGKYPMLFNERFWKTENFDMITDTAAHYFYHATKNQGGKEGVLICYATGDKADSLASIQQKDRHRIVLDALKPAFGNLEKYLSNSLIYYWGKDNYSYGAYAFYGKKQWFELRPILQENFMSCYFAGEHLADWQGFMEGAIQSGFDAVDSLGI